MCQSGWEPVTHFSLGRASTGGATPNIPTRLPPRGINLLWKLNTHPSDERPHTGIATFRPCVNSRKILPFEHLPFGRKVMEWFNQKTSIAGIQVSNWMIALGAIIVILLAYSLMR
jgi:hypothetical protein